MTSGGHQQLIAPLGFKLEEEEEELRSATDCLIFPWRRRWKRQKHKRNSLMKLRRTDADGRKEWARRAGGRGGAGNVVVKGAKERASGDSFLPSFHTYMSYQWENVTPLTFYLLLEAMGLC